MNKIDKKKELLLQALEKTLGVITPACKEVGISRNQFYIYYNTDEDFRKKVDDLQEITLDFVENQLLKKIKEGSEKAIMFFMKYKGRKRGYSERLEIDGNINQQIKVIKLIGPDGVGDNTHEGI